MKKSILLVLICLLTVGLLVGCGAQKETKKEESNASYPEKDINILLAFSPGGASDLQARIIEKYFKKEFGVNPVITYQAGAGGEVGFTATANAKKDGYTIGGLNVPHIVLQPQRNAQFNLDSFDYICQQVSDPHAIAVHVDNKEIQTLDDLIEKAKANPGKITGGMIGTMTGDHIHGLLANEALGIEMTLVPFATGSEEIASFLGKHTEVSLNNISAMIKEKDSYRILAIASEKRHPWLPDVPTYKELGYDIVSSIQRGYAVPKGTDPAKVERIREGFKNICTSEAYLEEMKKTSLPAEYLNGPEWEENIRKNGQKAIDILKKNGLLD